MSARATRTTIFALTASALGAIPADAQPLGAFTWQLQPFCNRVTVNVTQDGGVYTLDGYDDQCASAQRAPLVGLAAPNADGSIGLGFHIVTVPGGRTVSVEARLTPGPYSGPWTDSAGNSGTAVLNGAATGSPRPMPSAVPPWGTTITAPAGAIDQGGLAVRVPDAGLRRGIAVLGEWGPAPTPDARLGAGVAGVSHAQIGVYGLATTGVGVRGDATSGDGVLGLSDTGSGVYGSSGSDIGVMGRTDTGVGVRAQSTTGTGLRASSSSGTSVDLAGGPIQVSGTIARRPVFYHTTAPANTVAHVSTVDHPLLNGNANAVVFVTHAFVPGATVLNPNPVGVWYDTGINRWRIFNENMVAMPSGVRFSVLVVNTVP